MSSLSVCVCKWRGKKRRVRPSKFEKVLWWSLIIVGAYRQISVRVIPMQTLLNKSNIINMNINGKKTCIHTQSSMYSTRFKRSADCILELTKGISCAWSSKADVPRKDTYDHINTCKHIKIHTWLQIQHIFAQTRMCPFNHTKVAAHKHKYIFYINTPRFSYRRHKLLQAWFLLIHIHVGTKTDQLLQ